MSYNAWGRTFSPEHDVRHTSWRHEALPEIPEGRTALPYGLGRSYGDSCLNDGGLLFVADRMNRLISFHADTGVLRCEGGMSLADILDFIVPRGWFLPVTPGTKYVTVAGAIANDVHGKNHHRAATFGNHVTRFELMRSDGSRMECTPKKNPEWYRATLGGLGLTGLITWAEFKLKPIHNPYIRTEHIRFGGLDEFFDLAEASDKDFEYTVAWIDCIARGASLGRGIFMRGNSAEAGADRGATLPKDKKSTVPCDAPEFLLNQYTVKAFNTVFYHKQLRKQVDALTHYEPYFYPLDAVLDWNRLYGKRGFFQYQCVVPCKTSREPIRNILKDIAQSGESSFLAVLKVFGSKKSPGLLSFPQPGVTLALDIPNNGRSTLDLMDRLDLITAEAGGAVYPAKDARMSAEHFKIYFPHWQELLPFVDPKFSSSFWRRVTS